MGWRYISPFFLCTLTSNNHPLQSISIWIMEIKKKKTRDNITEVRAKTLRANMTKVATPNHLCLGNPLD